MPIPFLEGFPEFRGYLITIATREIIQFPTLSGAPNKKPNGAGSL
jgi:hypothetical protein